MVLFQPDQAANFGAALRLCACLDIELHYVEPAGFPLSDKTLKRVALDYGAHCTVVRHASWDAFVAVATAQGGALIAVETGSACSYVDHAFGPDDWLVLGRETEGLAPDALEDCAVHVSVPMQSGARSLNVVVTGAIVAGEALRQTRWASGAS